MTTALEIKSLQKSNTFSSLATGGQRLGTWFDRRARKISMKCSKSITLGRSDVFLRQDPACICIIIIWIRSQVFGRIQILVLVQNQRWNSWTWILTKYSSILLHAIHSLFYIGGLYRKLYSTLVLKLHTKKSAKPESSVYSWIVQYFVEQKNWEN